MGNIDFNLIEKEIKDLLNVNDYKNFLRKTKLLDIEDYDMSVILRLFFKYHTNFSSDNYDLFRSIFIDNVNKLPNFFNSEDDNITIVIIKKFFNLIEDKSDIEIIFNNWYYLYDSENFWKKNNNDKIKLLTEKKELFYGVFDCSKGGTPYHIKLISMLTDNNRNIVLDDLVDRLICLTNIINKKIFIALDIKLITIDDIYRMSKEEIIKYVSTIFNGINTLLNNSIELFAKQDSINNELNVLLNPSMLSFNITNNNIDEDMDDLIFSFED